MDQHHTPQTPVAQAMLYEHRPMVTAKGVPIDPPDKGTPFSRMVAVALAIVVASLTILFQNTGDDLHRAVLGSPPAPPPPELTINDPAPGTYGSTDILSRIYLKMRRLVVSAEQMENTGGGSKFHSPSMMSNIDPMIQVDEDRVRAAIMSAEFENTESALNRLDKLEADLAIKDSGLSVEESHPLLARDIRVLRTIYAGEIDTLTQEDRDYLVTRYQLLGRGALTFGMSDNDPARKPLVTGAIAPLLLIGSFALLVLLTGFVMLVVGIVLLGSGKIRTRMHRPTRGGSVFLETYAVFVGAFLVYVLIATMIDHYPSLHQYGVFILPAQWILLVTVFWGLLRGMNFSKWRHAIGLYGGRKLLTEMGVGVLVYLASVPLFLLGTLVTILLFTIKEWLFPSGEGESLPPNEIFEIIAKGDTVTVILLLTLATIWAPICEELIFRGALFRHLRGYLHWTLAALGSAVLFAFMHSYGPLFVTPLIVLGFMFAFMRHWRGSLIAPMTAHFTHNFSIMMLTVLMVRLIS
ncbi:MAG: CPBP family intramembrane metalloprotease [Phycisphaerales bacterium]|nr:CPBP family intramembrane metalloprotease [Phycisphaerales bacterium]